MTEDLTVLRSSSLTGAIERELEHMILTGAITPGGRLNEVDLASRFGTSRGPLREATRSLQAKGLVDIVRNRGVFVRSISPAEALEIYDVRAAIFGLAGRLLADTIDQALHGRLAALVDAMEVHAAADEFDGYYRTNLAFHAALIDGTDNATLAREYRGFVDKLQLCRARGLVQPGALLLSNREHREMLDAVAAGNRDRAQEAFFRHVERAKRRFAATLDDVTK